MSFVQEKNTYVPKEYNREEYWNDVAKEIAGRSDGKLIAGDDEPYYRYKRELFLKFFQNIDFSGKVVLEIGSGPGGNLEVVHARGAKRTLGVDISPAMVQLATERLAGKGIEIQKIDGTRLPFETDSIDIVFTSTVLQHNTDESELKKLVAEIARVSHSEVILFERIEKVVKGHESNLGRPVDYYAGLFSGHGFVLEQTKFLPLRVSYYVSGAIRKLFNPASRKEGEPLTKTAVALQAITLPLTRLLDKIVPCKRDLGMLSFRKSSRT